MLAQPLGDSGADEELVLERSMTPIAMAMVDDLTGALTPARRAGRRPRCDDGCDWPGVDESAAATALALMGTMPAYLEAPGAAGVAPRPRPQLGVLAQSTAPTRPSTCSASRGLRDRFELVLSAQEAGAYKPDLRPYRMAVERIGAAASEVVFVSTHWWDVAGAKRAGLKTAWVARRERSLLDTVPTPDYTGRDLTEAADAIVAACRLTMIQTKGRVFCLLCDKPQREEQEMEQHASRRGFIGARSGQVPQQRSTPRSRSGTAVAAATAVKGGSVPRNRRGIQLYTLRRLMENQADASSVLQQLGSMGYTEVETAGHYGWTARSSGNELRRAGLRAVAGHDGPGFPRRRRAGRPATARRSPTPKGLGQKFTGLAWSRRRARTTASTSGTSSPSA